MGVITDGERHDIIVRFMETVDAQASTFMRDDFSVSSDVYLVGDALSAGFILGCFRRGNDRTCGLECVGS